MESGSCCSADNAELSQAQGTSSTHAEECPITGAKGKKVSPVTVKAMLGISLTAVRETDYYFCPDPDCPVVYFSADHNQTFTAAEVRERVYQKQPSADDVLVCYCFRYTRGDIQKEARDTDANTVAEKISEGIRAGQCGCELRNPQGSCCLGNVNALVKSLDWKC